MALRIPIENQGRVELVDVPIDMTGGYYFTYNDSEMALLLECPGKWRHHYEHHVTPRKVRIYNSRAEADAHPNKVTCGRCGTELHFSAWLKNKKNNGEHNENVITVNKRKIGIHAYVKKRWRGTRTIKHVASAN